MRVEQTPRDVPQSEDKREKFLQLEGRLAQIRNEIAVAQNKLNAVAERRPQLIPTIQSRIDGLKEEEIKKRFRRDLLNAQNIPSIDDIANKQAVIQKVESKNGKVASFKLKEKFDGRIIIDQCTTNKAFKMQVSDGRIFQIPTVKSIKLCTDSTYLIETNNSWYRLALEENNKKDGDIHEEEYRFQEAVEGLSPGDKIISHSGTIRKVKKVVGDEIRTVNLTANRYDTLSIEKDFRDRGSEWVASITKAEK